MKRAISLIIAGIGIGWVGTQAFAADAPAEVKVARPQVAPVPAPAAEKPAVEKAAADKAAKPADVAVDPKEAEKVKAAVEAEAAKKLKEKEVAAQQAAQVKAAAVRKVAFSSKAQRDAQKQSVKNMTDGGTFNHADLVRLGMTDGRLKIDWGGSFPSGQARRIKVKGTDATWIANQFDQGVNSYYTLARYDFDAPDDQIWMVSMTIQRSQNMVTMYAQGGDSSEVMRMHFSQQPNMVVMNVTGWGENGRPRQVLTATAPDLYRLRADQPEAVRKFLVPVIKRITGQSLYVPGPADAYRAFPQIPADPKVMAKVEALLPELVSTAPVTRERAAAALTGLGSAGALAAIRMDAGLLTPEQAGRLDELVTAHCRRANDDAEALAKDVDFLLDCIEDDDRAVRAAAHAALEKALGSSVKIDLDAKLAQREAATDAIRAKIAKERKATEPADEKKAEAPQAVPLPALINRGQILLR